MRLQVLLVLALLSAGCSQDPAPEPASGEAPPPDPAPEPMPEVYVVATDQSYRPQSLYRFFPEAANAAADAPFNLTLKSAGGNNEAHSLVIPELDIRLAVTAEFEQATATVTVPAGSYTFFCDVGQHRTLGMEGTLTVS